MGLELATTFCDLSVYDCFRLKTNCRNDLEDVYNVINYFSRGSLASKFKVDMLVSLA